MQIFENYSLKGKNSFRVEAQARYLVKVNGITDVKELLKSSLLQEHQCFILGGGNNILFSKDFDGLIIKPEMNGVKLVKETKEAVFIRSGSGEYWPAFLATIVSMNLWGAENLALIPGSVGAVAIQNIGAYGVEAKEVIEEVEMIDLQTGEILKLSKEDCKFGYRTSIFKNELFNKVLISSVLFKFGKKPHPVLEYGPLKENFRKNIKPGLMEIFRYITNLRMARLPNPEKLANAGSFFKNPVLNKDSVLALIKEYPEVSYFEESENKIKLSAAWLIDKCGWKGKRKGDAGVYEKHALILVNHGQATGKEIFDLSEEIRGSVLKKFGVELEREVIVI